MYKDKEVGGKPFQRSSAALPDGMRVKAPTRDIAGHRFGRLLAIRVVGKTASNSLLWLCHCDCGKTVERSSAGLRKSKGVSSCGCYLAEVSKQRLKNETPWNKGRTYSTKPANHEYRNNKAWATAVKRTNGKACQICGWDEASCDVHHKTPRSAGGKNTIDNGIVLCPNHHRIEHEKEVM